MSNKIIFQFNNFLFSLWTNSNPKIDVTVILIEFSDYHSYKNIFLLEFSELFFIFIFFNFVLII